MIVSLDVMHSKPGIYLVVHPVTIGFVETDAEGRCWQLKLSNFERDGELVRDRWLGIQHLTIVGPLARPAK